MALPPHMTCREKGNVKTTPTYRGESLFPWPVHPPALLRGAPGQGWRMRECGLSIEHHPCPCRAEHTHHGNAGQCRWPPDGTARCPPGTGLWGAQPAPGTGSRHRHSPACTHSAAHSAAQGDRGSCVSENTQIPDPCIPVEMGVSLQNASTACWGCDRAGKSHVACPTPTPRQCHIEASACAVCLS